MKTTKILLYLFMIMFMFCGCSNSNALGNDLALVKDKAIEESSNTSPSIKKRVEKIKEAVLQMDGITDVSVVITGKTVLIGIKTSETNVDEIQRIKSETVKIVRTVDKYIEYTAITSNNEISDMIEKMEKERI